ncbi:Na/Pi cotransporter family protein [Ruegeria profundi]|uniref:Na/Pi cotransporter family protein n=1 Tax=Ruegeria profundi TaxID=1685378 RepID=UPI001CD39FB7|nr:Na/Pi symporter [Ruegeria profundi]MCA0926807.1 Na/Pi symporter [Ruegeria profundi]
MIKYYLPVAIGAILIAFWASPDVQVIAAGIAIFLFGMLMLEDGFKLLGGGTLERMLQRATKSVSRSLLFGFVSTSLLQSSSLVSVITISFLSAGLISLIGGVGIIFGANIGTTTGAWLVAGLGLKVNIASYAMPIIGISIILVFQKSKVLRGIGYVFGGLGFLFLGIHYMKEGFDAFKDQVDLIRFALPGFWGLLVYCLLGTVATVIMQSSHATMVLTLTALAASQISYDNALALAIGANIGTTITAIIGSISANFQGKRLALAHLIFNTATALVALVCIVPLRELVDLISGAVGIGAEDYTLKLAVFHTIFNVLGVLLMLPLMQRLITFLERSIVEPTPDVSQPRYLNDAVDDFPQTLEIALRKEVLHLYDNAMTVILHGLNLHRQDVLGAKSVAEVVRNSRTPTDMDIEESYQRKIKTLYSAIVEFSTRVGEKRVEPDVAERVYALRDVSGDIVQAVKSVKHLRKNVLRYTVRPTGSATDLYDGLRTEIARILVEIQKLEETDPEERSTLWLDQERAQIEEDAQTAARRVEEFIRKGQLTPAAATSFLNDSDYAYSAMRKLIEAARTFYIERDNAMAEVERLLALEEEELGESRSENDKPSNEASSKKRHRKVVESK